MINPRQLHPILHRFLAPAGEGGEGGGADKVDRGDDFTPNDEDPALAARELAEKEDAEAKAQAEKDAEAAEKEAAEKAEKEKGGKDGKKDTRIPLSRHTEILAKERERREQLEKEIANTRQAGVIAKTNEDITAAETKVAEMDKEYLKLLAEGKVDEAAAKMGEIRKAERAIHAASTQLETQAAEARAYERVKYDTTVERLEAAFPAINPDHDDFDKEKTGEVIELRDAYLATGKYTRADALQKACKTLLKPATGKQEAAVEVDVRVDKEDLAKAAAEERKKAAVDKALDTSKKQPPNTAHMGADSDKAGGTLRATDVIKLPQKDFAKLDDKALAKLRGDEL